MKNPFITLENQEKYGQDLSRKTNPIFGLDENGDIVKIGDDPIFDKIQEFKEQCDIYNILARYENGDLLALGDESQAVYGDVSSHDENGLTIDLLTSDKNISNAVNAFAALPAGVRSMFDDDVVKFLQADDKTIQDALNKFVDSQINKAIDSHKEVDE